MRLRSHSVSQPDIQAMLEAALSLHIAAGTKINKDFRIFDIKTLESKINQWRFVLKQFTALAMKITNDPALLMIFGKCTCFLLGASHMFQ